MSESESDSKQHPLHLYLMKNGISLLLYLKNDYFLEKRPGDFCFKDNEGIYENLTFSRQTTLFSTVIIRYKSKGYLCESGMAISKCRVALKMI